MTRFRFARLERLFEQIKLKLRLSLKSLEDPRYRDSTSLLDQAGGGRVALLALVTDEGEIAARYFIFTNEFWVGREPEINDLVLDSDKVCLRHCRFCQYAGNFYIEDFASKNGTYLDGRRISRRRQRLLPEACSIRIADINFRFQVD